MNGRIPVLVVARDPISAAGTASHLRYRKDVEVVESACEDCVALVVADDVEQDTLQEIKVLRSSGARVVLVVTEMGDTGLLAAVEAGASGVVRRGNASAETLVRAIEAAAVGDGSLPPDLLGRLLDQVTKLQQQVLAPRGLTLTGLTDRETRVLKLIAAGYDTCEVADKLYFSERTVKNVIHDLITRLNLKNRTHAVAYAVRQGLI